MKLFPVRLSNINKMLDFYSQFNPSPLSIKQFIDFGKYYINNIFLFDTFYHWFLRS